MAPNTKRTLLESLTKQPKVKFSLSPEHIAMLRQIASVPDTQIALRHYRGTDMSATLNRAWELAENGFLDHKIDSPTARVATGEDQFGHYKEYKFVLLSKGLQAI